MAETKNIKERAREMRQFLLDMIADAKRECREFTDEEQKLFDEQKNELLALSEEIKNTEDKLDEIENELPDIEDKASEEEEKPAEEQPAVPAEEAPEESPENAPEEKPAAEEEKPAEPEDKQPEEEKENPSEGEKINNDEEPAPAEEKPAEEDPEKDKKETKSNTTTDKMNKNFSLLKAIRSAAYGKQYDALTEAVMAEGQKDFRDANLEVSGGSILLPGEARTITINDEHDEVVKEDWEPLLLPLFKNKVLGNARHLTGLKNDIRIPSLTALDCNWEGEITKNQETSTSFDHVLMKPHRISTTIYLSKQFLMQESLGAEQTIRNLLVEALDQKLEATFLGKGAADNSGGKNIPAGLLNGKTAKVVDNFAKLCDFESDAVDANYNLGAMKYVLSPKAWAKIRGTFQYGGKNTAMVLEGNNIDGRPYEISQNLATNEYALINWSDIYVGQWAGTEISVDGTSVEMARTAQVAITLNAWFDAIAVRDEAIQLATVAAGTIDSSTQD